MPWRASSRAISSKPALKLGFAYNFLQLIYNFESLPLIKLFPLKTRNARRVLYLNKILLQHLKQMYALRKEAEVRLAAQRQQNQTIIIDMNGEPLSCLEMVNTLPDGKIQTVNSMKYHSKVCWC